MSNDYSDECGHSLTIRNSEINFAISSNLVLTVINASAAVTLLEQRPEKNSGSERDSNPRLCDASAMLSQLSYQSHMIAVDAG